MSSLVMVKTNLGGKHLNFTFCLVMFFLACNVFFSWYSPSWVSSLGVILIDEQKKKEDESKIEKMENVEPLPSAIKFKLGQIQLETSISNIKPNNLGKIVDNLPETNLSLNGVFLKGSFISVIHPKPFQVKKIVVPISAAKTFKAVLQTSPDGVVFSNVKILKKGQNEIMLNNEKIQAIRIIILLEILGESWSIDDIVIN